ncbi:MAG: hypothetical protein VKO01_07240 [Cyanobacteriota bacterium]|nr:hypothetical protein [Cyanobacteriota bacterium]
MPLLVTFTQLHHLSNLLSQAGGLIEKFLQILPFDHKHLDVGHSHNLKDAQLLGR